MNADMLLPTLWNTLLPMAVGALITWLVSRHYYKRAAMELESEAAKLKRMSQLILRWLELGGENITIRRDENGNPVGLVQELNFSDSLSVSASVTGMKLKPDNSKS